MSLWLAGLLIFAVICAILVIFAVRSNREIEMYEDAIYKDPYINEGDDNVGFEIDPNKENK